MALHKAQPMSQSAFEEQVLNEGRTTLVCFLEEWSEPCKEMDQTIDALSDAFYGQLEVHRMDLEEAPLAAARFGINSIPALVLFVGGEPVQKLFGLREYEDIHRIIAKHLCGCTAEGE